MHAAEAALLVLGNLLEALAELSQPALEVMQRRLGRALLAAHGEEVSILLVAKNRTDLCVPVTSHGAFFHHLTLAHSAHERGEIAA
jgi:hypothetical protein